MIRDEAFHFFRQIKSPLPMGTRTALAGGPHPPSFGECGSAGAITPEALDLALSLPERLWQFQFPFLLAPVVSLLPADQIAAADGDENSVNAVVAHSPVKHGAQLRLVADGVVGDENASRYHAWHDEIESGAVDILLGIEEAETDAVVFGKMLERVAVDEVDDVGYFRGDEGGAG